MKDLTLQLKTKWFELTKTVKTEDYREITPYWCNRLLLLNGEKKSKFIWKNILLGGPSIVELSLSQGYMSFSIFKNNIMTLGYPKKTESDKIQIFEHAGIEIRTGNPEWGAKEGKKYFVIKHGKRIQ